MTAFNRPLDTGTRHAPTVSVVMAACNAEAYVARAIESVLDQTLADVPDRDYLLRHRDTVEAEAEAWLARLGRQAAQAGWCGEAELAALAAEVLRRLPFVLGAAQAGLQSQPG
jgi:hypothetical protein